MSIMNAEVTAENRPDSPTYQPRWLCGGVETHKNESGIQVLIVLFLKVVVMFGNFLFELVIEIGPGIRAAILLQHGLQGVT